MCAAAVEAMFCVVWARLESVWDVKYMFLAITKNTAFGAAVGAHNITD
jgi:hypothetical protein